MKQAKWFHRGDRVRLRGVAGWLLARYMIVTEAKGAGVTCVFWSVRLPRWVGWQHGGVKLVRYPRKRTYAADELVAVKRWYL